MDVPACEQSWLLGDAHAALVSGLPAGRSAGGVEGLGAWLKSALRRDPQRRGDVMRRVKRVFLQAL